MVLDVPYHCKSMKLFMGHFQAKCIIKLKKYMTFMPFYYCTLTASEKEVKRESGWISYPRPLACRERRDRNCLTEMGSKCWVPSMVCNFLLLAFKQHRKGTWRLLWAKLHLKTLKTKKRQKKAYLLLVCVYHIDVIFHKKPFLTALVNWHK